MKHVALALALVSFAACKKADDKAPATTADPADVADVDCEKMTSHTVELLIKQATKDKSADEAKQMTDAMAAKHPEMVKACEAEKPTKKLTHKQYGCMLAATSTTELAACFTPAN